MAAPRFPKQIPEDQLLDVGVMVFTSEELDEEQQKYQGTTPQTRKAEANFMVAHLKNTLQQSSQWGMVRVVPDDGIHTDVLVAGKILHSNGQDLVIAVEVSDATGRIWFKKRYHEQIEGENYLDTRKGEKDAFQNIYNVIANDMAEYKNRMNSKRIKTIRNVSLLRFSTTYAPDTYSGYLAVDNKNRATIKRLPAEDDPMLDRLNKIREREHMYLDTLDSLYDNYYDTMWSSYENWRKLNLVEREAIRKIKGQTTGRILIGTLLILAAVALGSSDANLSGLPTGLVIIGGEVIIDGVNISRNTELHHEAIKELSESFGDEMAPVVMDFEGKQYELIGTAQEQFKQWREIMQKIFLAETGFEPTDALTHPPKTD
jgi:hypothetical protein